MISAERIVNLNRPEEFEATAHFLLSKGRDIDGIMTSKGIDPKKPWEKYLLRGYGSDITGYDDIHVHYIFSPYPHYYQRTYSYSEKRGIYSISEVPLRERSFVRGYFADERECGFTEETTFKEAHRLTSPRIYKTALTSLTRRLRRVPLWMPL